MNNCQGNRIGKNNHATQAKKTFLSANGQEKANSKGDARLVIKGKFFVLNKESAGKS